MPNSRFSSRRAPAIVGVRRQSNWLASAVISGVTNIPAAGVLLVQSFTQAQIQAQGPLTIVRTVGTLMVRSDQVSAGEDAFGAIGMMVVREQARLAGVAALPTPTQESFDDGWFLHRYWNASAILATAVGMQRAERYDFDSRAQRKVTPDDAIVVTIENASSTAGATFVLQFRMLVKLH